MLNDYRSVRFSVRPGQHLQMDHFIVDFPFLNCYY